MLCVYQQRVDPGVVGLVDGSVRRASALAPDTDREGFMLVAASTAETSGVQSSGTWAVTAP